LPADEDDAAIVNSVIGLGKNLGCRVIAEGVEREDQADWLRVNGCRYAAGFWFARPMSASDFTARLDSSQP
jgi:EAL domain-containing protein (putative c-di-GMP-specific phosphodiesterase class I)